MFNLTCRCRPSPRINGIISQRSYKRNTKYEKLLNEILGFIPISQQKNNINFQESHIRYLFAIIFHEQNTKKIKHDLRTYNWELNWLIHSVKDQSHTIYLRKNPPKKNRPKNKSTYNRWWWWFWEFLSQKKNNTNTHLCYFHIGFCLGLWCVYGFNFFFLSASLLYLFIIVLLLVFWNIFLLFCWMDGNKLSEGHQTLVVAASIATKTYIFLRRTSSNALVYLVCVYFYLPKILAVWRIQFRTFARFLFLYVLGLFHLSAGFGNWMREFMRIVVFSMHAHMKLYVAVVGPQRFGNLFFLKKLFFCSSPYYFVLNILTRLDLVLF